MVHKGEEMSRNNVYPSASGRKHYADSECHDFTISILQKVSAQQWVGLKVGIHAV